MVKKLGIIINPIAGIGGRVGLKGSDGPDVLKKAQAMGGKSLASDRAIQTLQIISGIKENIQVISYPFNMGEDELRLAGFAPKIIGAIKKNKTTAEDTIMAAKAMLNAGVDLLLFAGGDGTARNIYSAVGGKLPVIGIPAGVKIHSSVFANNPRSAGKLAVLYLQEKITSLQESEVMDIDESAFREGMVRAQLYGYLQVPEEKLFLQNVKSGGYSNMNSLQGIASEIVEAMDHETLYVIGPGTTTRSIMENLGLRNTLLGVDIVKNKQLVANDVSEQQLWTFLHGNNAKLIITVIGGQGHIFGRGNQQLSPRIIRKVGKENIIVVSTKEKLLSIPSSRLFVDTGDSQLDDHLRGYIRVHTNYGEYTMSFVST